MTGAMATPPEALRLLLESGVGSGPLRAAAGAWMTLSAKYFDTATDLRRVAAGVAASVQAGLRSWQGIGAEAYVARHRAYAYELTRLGIQCTGVANDLYGVARAYDSALMEMPTMPELVQNRVTGAMLLVTNFFGVNTPLIALNEFQYMQMWLQAAAAMDLYQMLSTEAVISALAAQTSMPLGSLFVGDGISGSAALVGATAVADIDVGGAAADVASLAWGAISASATPMELGAGTAVPTSVPGWPGDSARLSRAGTAAGPGALARPGAILVTRPSVMVPQPDMSSAVSSLIKRPPLVPAAAPDMLSVLAGHQGAHSRGFTGTASKEIGLQPCGLTRAEADGFRAGPGVPVVPATWDPYRGDAITD